MRRLGYNESPTAGTTRYGQGSKLPKLIAVAFAALFLFFLGTATALADGVLGEVTDPVLDSDETDASDDSGLLKQVADAVVPGGGESRDAPDDDDDQPVPADARTADTQPAESTTSPQPDSAGAAASDPKADSNAGEPAPPDEGDTTAPPADETAGDEAAAGSVADQAETAVPSADPGESASEQPTRLTDNVSRVTEAARGLTDQVAGASNEAVDSVSDSAEDLVAGAAHVAGLPTDVVDGVAAGGDVAGLLLPTEVVGSGTAIVDELANPLENAVLAISSIAEQAEDHLDGTVELIATSVDAVARSSTATVDDLVATSDHLVERTAGAVEGLLVGSSAANVIADIPPVVAGGPKPTEMGPSSPPRKPVVPTIADQPRSDLSRPAGVEPGVSALSPSARDAAKGARSMPLFTIPGELLEVSQEMSDSGSSADRVAGPAGSILPATAHSSNASPSSGLFLVLAAMGVLAPRLSRWFRLEPVLWRRYALAAAIDRPG